MKESAVTPSLVERLNADCMFLDDCFAIRKEAAEEIGRLKAELASRVTYGGNPHVNGQAAEQISNRSRSLLGL